MFSTITNNIVFQATAGSKLLKHVEKEFNGDKVRTQKFAKLFAAAFEVYTDKNTVIDADKRRNLIFSNSAFPDFKYCYKVKESNEKSMAHKLLNECSKIIHGGEQFLFRLIISKMFKKYKSFTQLEVTAKKWEVKDNFFKELSVARRIVKENPDSKLSNIEFDWMEMKIEQENIKEIQNRIFGNVE